jgi:hypothetical protein
VRRSKCCCWVKILVRGGKFAANFGACNYNYNSLVVALLHGFLESSFRSQRLPIFLEIEVGVLLLTPHV